MPITIPRKVIPIEAAKPEPAPAAPPAPDAAQANAEATLEAGRVIAAALTSNPAPLVWNFKVTYDSDGRITNIKATGTQP